MHSFTQPPDNLLAYREFEIESPEGLRTLVFDELKPQGQTFVGHIKGCDVREQCGAWVGSELLLAKQGLPELETGYYWHELEGLRVITTQGDVLGSVHHLMETGANDVLVVRGDDTSVDRLERLLPWVEDQVVLDVDLKAGTVTVAWDPAWDREPGSE